MPLAAFVAASILLLGFHGDQWLADRIYALQGHQWALQNAYVTQDLLHAGGRQASKNAWFALLLASAIAVFVPGLRQWRRPLLYLLLASLLSTAAVGLLKRWTDMDCPWDLSAFDGTRPFISLLTPRPEILGSPKCFPAAHAATGFAWIGLYFFFAAVRPSWRWAGLAIGLLLGLSFGLAQQLRGAHFLSHDIASLTLCWWVACAVELLARSERSAA